MARGLVERAERVRHPFVTQMIPWSSDCLSFLGVIFIEILSLDIFISYSEQSKISSQMGLRDVEKSCNTSWEDRASCFSKRCLNVLSATLRLLASLACY